MKKILTSAVALTFAVLSANAMACPKGTTLQGGTGPKHKGGKCVVVKQATPTKAQEKKAAPAKVAEKKTANAPAPTNKSKA